MAEWSFLPPSAMGGGSKRQAGDADLCCSMQVVFRDSGTPPTRQAGGGFRHLGYCPQEDVLWPDLTVREHLDLYSAVKGLTKEEAALSVSRCGAKPPAHGL